MKSFRAFTDRDVEAYLVATGQAETFLTAVREADHRTVAKLLNKAIQDKTGQGGVELAELYIQDTAFAAALERRIDTTRTRSLSPCGRGWPREGVSGEGPHDKAERPLIRTLCATFSRRGRRKT
ncbi:MAG: hypothetical protein J7515_17270, partial [Caulobacter sp.]|nr:hypothetical protein [Caulobacter sp.]